MTDKEKVIKLLSEFGVGFNTENNQIICEEGMRKVEGYMNFSLHWHFDEKEKFERLRLSE